MKIKNRYTVDDSNRLTIKSNRKSLVTDGRFSIDRDNRLTYWLNESSAWRRQYDLPQKIRYLGNWRLSPNYNLELILDETKEQFRGNRLVLRGKIISTDRDTLVFEIKSYDKQGQTHIQLLKLTGSWQADEHNRICFAVRKKAIPDILTLEGSWQLNQDQQIIYTYEKTELKTKTKTTHILTFEGFWQINSSHKLTYILSRSSESRFDFRAQIESPNLYPQEGVIKYRIGIGLKGLSPKGTVPNKIISLYGTWKFDRNLGLIFQMDYGKNEVRNIEFGANVNLSKKDAVIFSLVNKRHEPLGLYLTFSHRFLKKLDAETYLRLMKRHEDSAIETGVKIPF